MRGLNGHCEAVALPVQGRVVIVAARSPGKKAGRARRRL
jgi:hypothetical protein